MRLLLAGILLLALCPDFSAQNEDEVSVLRKRLQYSEMDTSQVTILLELCKHHLATNPDSSLVWATMARDVSREFKDAEKEAYSTLYMGRSYGYAGKVEEAKSLYLETRQLYLKMDDVLTASDLFFETGVEYIFISQYDSSLVYLLKALPVFEEFKDTSRLGKIYNNMAIVYRRMAFYDEAQTFYRKSYEIRKAKGDRAGMSTSLLNIGVLHFHTDQYDSSLAVLDQALELAIQEDQRDVMGIALMDIAANLQRLGRHEESIPKAHEAMQLLTELGDDRNARLVYSTLGNAHGKMGNCDSALYYIELGEEGILEMDYRQSRINYSTKSYCAALLGDFEAAHTYKTLEMAYQDSVSQDKQRERVAAIQVKFEQTVRKKDLLAKEKEIAEASAAKSKAINVAAFAGILALTIGFLAVFINLRSKRKRERMQAVVDRHMSEIEMLQSRVAQLADAPAPSWKPKISAMEMNQYLMSPLTSRELEVLSLIAKGKSNQKIADETYVSINTIKTHVNHIYEKLDVKNRTQATMKASKLNLLEREKARGYAASTN